MMSAERDRAAGAHATRAHDMTRQHQAREDTAQAKLASK